MTRRCVRIAYRSETDEKEMKMGRVGLLPGTSRAQVKASVRRQDPVFVVLFLSMQNLKNRPAYIRTKPCTHEFMLRIQARAHAYKNTDRSSSLIFSSLHDPKSILNMFLPLLSCQVFIKTHPTTKPKHLHGQKHIKMEDHGET